MNRFSALSRVAVVPITLLVACGGSDSVDVGDAAATSDDGSSDARGADGAGGDASGNGDDGGGNGDTGDANVVSDSGTAGLMQSLGTAGAFVVLGSATVTNSGVGTVLTGDIGTTGPSITGLTGHPFQPSGSTEINNARAAQALLDVGTAYTSLTGRACPPANQLTGQDLGGLTLAPGVYCFTSSAGQTGATTLTFDAKGDPNAVWIIQVATALTIMDNAIARVIGGPPSLACRIFWTTGTAATINGGALFVGNVLASSKTSMLTGATLSPGRAYGQTDGVTLLDNTISAAACP
jgi:type VI secretion system secreted protein VgrG